MKHLLLTTIAAVLLVGCGESKAPDISIHDAAEEGNIEAVKQNLAEGIDVDARDYLGATPLHGAATFGHKEIAELLIAKGADVNAKGGIIKVTPLHDAASKGYKEIVELLIDKGADVNAKSENETTPLHAAAFDGYKEVAELLIAEGADVNAKHVTGGTPLDSAERVIEFRLPGLEERSEDKVKAAKKETADLLRKHGGKTRDWLKAGDEVYTAARAGHIEAVKQHLAKGIDVNEKQGNGETSLHEAARYGHKETAELLIKEGADLNPRILFGRLQGMTPLDLAVWRKRTETVELLRKHGSKTGDWLKAGDSIHIAAKAGHIEAVKKHLADGTGVNAIGEFRKASPLYMAAYSYNAEATKFLLENGADVHQLDFKKETALHTAAYHSYHGEGDVSVVALLVDHGSKINAISDRGLTSLDLAILAGTPEVADLLRKHGGKTGEELKAEGK
jgi:ankyrin repeat protein